MQENRFGIVLLPEGMIGGAEKRFINIIKAYNLAFEDRLYFLVTDYLYKYLLDNHRDFPFDLVKVIGNEYKVREVKQTVHNHPWLQKEKVITSDVSFPRQVFRFLKSFVKALRLFVEIYYVSRKENINVLMGIYSGVFPLYLFKDLFIGTPKIIFSDMDASFFEVLPIGRKFWYRRYNSFNLAFRVVDHLDFLSEGIFQNIMKRGLIVTPEKVTVSPTSFADYNNCFLGDKTKTTVSFVARLEPTKNPLLFIEVIRPLVKKYEDVDFIIAGNGFLASEVARQVEEIGSPNLRFVGWLKDPSEILGHSSIFVSLQQEENYPSQIILEAMACGNFILASDVGETFKFINGQTGAMVPLLENVIRQKIEELINDIDQVHRVGRTAREYVLKNFTIETVLLYYQTIFYALISEKK